MPENSIFAWSAFRGSLRKDAYVCTFLLDVNQEDIEPPLSNFQNTKFEKEDMRKLIHTLNSALPKANERALEEKVLDESFETYWPRLEQDLKKIISEKPKKKEPERKQKEILAEILEIVRSIQRKNQMEDWADQLAALKIMQSKSDRNKAINYLAHIFTSRDSSALNPDSIEAVNPRLPKESIRDDINKGD